MLVHCPLNFSPFIHITTSNLSALLLGFYVVNQHKILYYYLQTKVLKSADTANVELGALVRRDKNLTFCP